MSTLRIGRLNMMGFALPAMPINSLLTALFVFLPPLYAEHRGLGALVGSVFLTAKLFDMATDPIFGLLADRYPTRWGRRRPWLVLAVPILMLAVYRLFLPPAQAGSSYFATWLVVMYVGWTLATISHTAWALELSGDYDERSRITGRLQVFVMVGAIVVSLIPACMERLGTPTFEEKTAAIGFFLIVTLPLAVLLCLLSVPERPLPPQPYLGWWAGVSIVFGNMALLRLLIANALLTFSTYFVQGLFVFFVSYELGLEHWVGFILTCLVVGGLICIPLWIKLSESWGKHKTVQMAVFFGAVSPLLLLILPAGEVGLAAFFFLLVGVNTSANEFLPRAMMADVCDHDNVNTGSERMGLYYALLQFSSKLASGLAVFIGFSFLSFFGFVPELGQANSPESLLRLRHLIVALPVAAYAVVIVLMWKYPITRERQEEMRRIIEERTASEGQG